MNTYWWSRPSYIGLFVVMPIACFAFNASDGFYHQFGAYNAITADRFFPVWLSILGFSGASWFAESVGTGTPFRPTPYMRESNFTLFVYAVVIVATIATFVLLYPLLTNVNLLTRILANDPGAAYLARALADKIPGVTSLENFFPFVVVILMVKRQITGSPRTLGDNLVLIFVLAVTGLKVVLYSERLALIEMLVPVALLTGGQRKRSVVWAIAPLAGVAVMFNFFMVTEYFRSWAFYAGGSSSLVEFALNRMIGYYMTAINNGAFVYGEGNSYFFPIWSAGWLWRLPIPGLFEYWSALTGASVDLTGLLAGLNVEYNNTSGIYAPLTDFGPVLGVFVWTALGLISGRLHRYFHDGNCLGLIVFPTWFVGVLEIPRVFYWGDSRYLPPFVLSMLFVGPLLYFLPDTKHGARTRPRVGGQQPGQTGVITLRR